MHSNKPLLLHQLRLFRVVRVVKLMKAAPGLASLLVTVRSSTRHVLNLGVLLCLLFFIASSLGMELFGRISCSEEYPCKGLSRHANFNNVGMSFLTLFRVATGDNWSGILQDTLRQPPLCDSALDCRENCCASSVVLSSLYFVCFVVLAQFIMLNVVVAVLMKNLTEAVHLYDTSVFDAPTSDTSAASHLTEQGQRARLNSDSSMDDAVDSAEESDVSESSGGSTAGMAANSTVGVGNNPTSMKAMVQHSICARDPAIEPHVKELLVKLQKRTERRPEAGRTHGAHADDDATTTRSHALKASLHLVMAMIHMMSDAEKTRESLRSAQQPPDESQAPRGSLPPTKHPQLHPHNYPRRMSIGPRRSLAHPLKATIRRPHANRVKVSFNRTSDQPPPPPPPPPQQLSATPRPVPLPGLLPRTQVPGSDAESTSNTF